MSGWCTEQRCDSCILFRWLRDRKCWRSVWRSKSVWRRGRGGSEFFFCFFLCFSLILVYHFFVYILLYYFLFWLWCTLLCSFSPIMFQPPRLSFDKDVTAPKAVPVVALQNTRSSWIVTGCTQKVETKTTREQERIDAPKIRSCTLHTITFTHTHIQ